MFWKRLKLSFILHQLDPVACFDSELILKQSFRYIYDSLKVNSNTVWSLSNQYDA